MTTSYEIASMFLRDIGAPDTQGMRRAVAIWLRFETGNTVYGNNPWNLHSGAACDAERKYCPGQGSLPGQIGNRYAGPGDKNVAVFGTINDGVRASANNIMRQGYGYPAVIRAARANDPIAFMTALQNSSWSAGHYGYSKLVNAVKSGLTYNFNVNLVTPQASDMQPVSSRDGEPLTFWKAGDRPGVTFPRGHILTADDVTYILDQLRAQGYFDDDVTGIAQKGLEGLLNAMIGREWNEQLALDIQKGLGIGAGEVADVLNPVKGLTDIVGFLFDAQNWFYILGLLAGVALAGVGGKLIIDATGQQLPTTESLAT
jgi:hypothetical protein